MFVHSGGEQVTHVNKNILELDGKVVIVDNDDKNDNAHCIVGCGCPNYKKYNIDLRIVIQKLTCN